MSYADVNRATLFPDLENLAAYIRARDSQRR